METMHNGDLTNKRCSVCVGDPQSPIFGLANANDNMPMPIPKYDADVVTTAGKKVSTRSSRSSSRVNKPFDPI